LTLRVVGELQQLPYAFGRIVNELSSREREMTRGSGAIQRERQVLDEAQRTSHVGSWSWDTAIDEVTWSAEMYRIFGRDPERGPATSEEFLAYLHTDDRERVAEGYAQTFGGGPTFELDYRIVGETGATRTLHALGHLDGELAGCYVGTVQDVTELRQAEIDVRRERDYAAAITRSMRDGFLLTREGTILEVNEALCGITGFAREELLGAHVPYPFWAPEAAAEIQRQRELIREELGHEFETTYVRKDGTRFDAAITVVAARAGDGAFLGYVSTVRDISEQKRYEVELERLAAHDPLTGMANHRVLHEQLNTEVARANRHGHPLSFAVLDLDHFKRINDKHGHPAGDRVLCETARRLQTLARAGELLARVGGEEFAWILNAGGLDAFAAAERARSTISATPFPGVGTVTLSVGVCDLTDASDFSDASGSEDLYRRADQALYSAKRHGRNRTVRYSPETARELAMRRSERT
jgi:diguanylate cyclase (GGDEF)-like protein/PAS domain S-box-containing protein